MKQEHNTMANKPIFPLLMKMAIPPMLSMLIQSMYNIIDSIFVAKLGEKALTALSLAFPLQNLSLAFSVGLGVAINALIAQNLGAKKNNLANNIASHGIFLSLLHSLLFIFIGVFLIKPFFSIFTNDPETLNYAITYGSIVITFTFGSIIHITIEKMFQATGNMIIPMFLQVVGAVVNIILDPILIFGINGYLKLGVSGAAIATIIGQISACLLAILLFRKKSFLKLSLIFFKILRNSCFSFSVILWYAVSLTCVEMLLKVSSISSAFFVSFIYVIRLSFVHFCLSKYPRFISLLTNTVTVDLSFPILAAISFIVSIPLFS